MSDKIEDLQQQLNEARAMIQMFGDAATDVFEQMVRGNWADDHGHMVCLNTSMLSLKSAVEKALRMNDGNNTTYE